MSVGLYSGTSGLALGVGLYSGVPGLWSGAAGLIDGLSPALDINFLTGAPLDSRITFTRASSATRVNASGVLETVGNNVARFDYDPVTLAPRGLLIEEQRTNLMVRSEEFDNATWVKTGGTVTANAVTSPDGTADADTFVEDTSTGGHGALQTTAVADNTVVTASAFIKAAGRSWVAVAVLDKAGASNRVWYNVSTGTQGTTNGTVTAFSATNVGGGWYRIAVTVSVGTGGVTPGIRISSGSADNVASYTGNGAASLYFYGAQLEAGAFATSYIPTVASQVTRSADVATMTGTNFSSWYNQSEGTMVADWTCPTAGSLPNNLGAFGVSDGTANERIQVRRLATTSTASFIVVDGGVIQYNEFTVTSASGAFKAALAYRLNEFQSCANGTLGSVDTSGTLPTPTQAEIGFGQGLTYLNGHIRSVAYYSTLLPNEQLRALTA